MKILLIIILLITFFSCKENSKKDESFHNNKIVNQSKKIIIDEKIYEINYCDTIANSIGIIKINKELFKKGDKIDIFNLDGSIYRSITFDDEKSILAYKCIENKNKKYFIQTDESEKYIIENQEFISLDSWERHLLNNVFSIDFDINENPIRESINGEIITAEKSNNRRISPVQIEDNWMKVKYEDFNTNKTVEGWIKWRNENCLFVELLYFA